MAVCQSDTVALYKIDPKTGKLTQLIKAQGDFL